MTFQRSALGFCILFTILLHMGVGNDEKIEGIERRFSRPEGRPCSRACFTGRRARRTARRNCRRIFEIRPCSRPFGRRNGFRCTCRRPTPPPQNNSLLLRGGRNDEDSIISCTDSTVFIQVSDPSSVSVNSFIWSIPDITPDFCSNCGAIVRRVNSVSPQSTFGGVACPPGAECFELSTTLATFSELFSPSVLQQFGLTAAADEPFEPLYGCTLPTISRDLKDVISLRQVSSVPNSARAFLRVNADGRCAFTDCFVGPGGNAEDCFYCGAYCDNGCGPDGALGTAIPEGFPGLYDFSSPCGTHDNCYSSTFSKDECDLAFLRDLMAECSDSFSTRFIIPIDRIGKGLCLADAQLYYSAVARFGNGAFEDAQRSRRAHESTSTCIAQCPTRQESGGQGTTTLTVDLMRNSGTFEVFYNMFTIPDGLDVFYEGNTIFTTGGLVSGSRTVPITYSGNATVVQVRISAPRSGTAWTVSVACPP